MVVGWVNGFLTVTLGLPSFITTLGTGFILLGLTLTTSHAYPATIPAGHGGHRRAGSARHRGPQFIWAVVLAAIFHVVLTRTRWGLHTIAVGGNALGAREAGINVGRIKYGNFMLTAPAGRVRRHAERLPRPTPSTRSGGGYQPMFYAVTAAVIGGTAMLGGPGTIIGAFLGAHRARRP